MSEDNSVEHRLSDLEQRAAVQDERFRTMPEDVRQLRSDMAVLSQNLALLVQREHARKECPNPGLCLQLEPRISTLETWRNIVVGGSIVAWVAVCVLAIVAYDWTKAHFELLLRK